MGKVIAGVVGGIAVLFILGWLISVIGSFITAIAWIATFVAVCAAGYVAVKALRG